MNWAAHYVGIPFDDYDADGAAHCWGLVRRVYADRRGIMLPAYGELSAEDVIGMARSVKSETEQGPWQQIPAWNEQEFDVALMAKPGHPDLIVHVGVITANRHVLHIERATAAVCVSLDHPSVRNRYRGACRYIGKA